MKSSMKSYLVMQHQGFEWAKLVSADSAQAAAKWFVENHFIHKWRGEPVRVYELDDHCAFRITGELDIVPTE